LQKILTKNKIKVVLDNTVNFGKERNQKKMYEQHLSNTTLALFAQKFFIVLFWNIF
jgi:hypothetical protein